MDVNIILKNVYKFVNLKKQVIIMEPGIEDLKEFEENMIWLNKHYGELKSRHPDEYVAILGKRVVSHGKDLAKLMKELEEKYPIENNRIAVKYVTTKKIELIL